MVRFWKYYGLALLVIVIDQIVKLAVHQYMVYGISGEVKILGDVVKLHYTRNPGMAFGLEIGGGYGKIILTSFRIIAMSAIGYAIYRLAKTQGHPGLLVCLALVLGGAAGNILDSIFYGVTLGLYPPGSPSPWFHGEVIDMFYIHIWEGVVPEWVPLFGGQYTSLWPIFNVADSAIFCGIIAAIVFQNSFFADVQKPKPIN